MSYLATASAIRSAPSTWTSSRVKFLTMSVRELQPVKQEPELDILRRVIAADKIVYQVRMAD